MTVHRSARTHRPTTRPVSFIRHSTGARPGGARREGLVAAGLNGAPPGVGSGDVRSCATLRRPISPARAMARSVSPNRMRVRT